MDNRSGANIGSEHLIERQMLLRNARARALRDNPIESSKQKYRFITISRENGSMGDLIAQGLAGQLGWHLFDREIVNSISLNAHVRESLVEQLDERSQNLIQDTISRFLRMAEWASFGLEDYHHALLKTLAYLAAQGEAVIMGRGANFALRAEPQGLHVRVVASPEVRVQRLVARWNVPADVARHRMLEVQMERRNFVRRHFRREVDDLRYYDVVFNTDFVTVQQAVTSVMGMLSASSHPFEEPAIVQT